MPETTLSFELPTEEETKINIKIGDKIITMDYFDWNKIQREIRNKIEELGESNSEIQAELFVDEFKKMYGVTVSKFAVIVLQRNIDEWEDKLLKKFFPLQELQDSTEPEPSSATES